MEANIILIKGYINLASDFPITKLLNPYCMLKNRIGNKNTNCKTCDRTDNFG